MLTVLSRDGTTIAYERQGAGPPLVIVDGALCSRAFGPSAAQASRLVDSFTVYTYDRRGRGDSTDMPPYAVAHEIEDLKAVISAAGGSAFVYGISVGSVLALHAAAALGAAMIPRLVLHEPPFSVDDAAQEAYHQERREIHALLTTGRRSEAVVTFLREIMPPSMLEALQASPDWALLEATAPTLAYDYTVLGDGGIPVAIAQKIHVPVLLLVGAESASYKHTALDALMQALPHVEQVTVSGAGFEPTDAQIRAIVHHFNGDM